MHSLAQAMRWLDTHSIGWSLAVVFVGMFVISGAACLVERLTWRWAHRHEIHEEWELAARVERMRRAARRVRVTEVSDETD